MIKSKTFHNHKIFKTKFLGRPLIIETGKFALLANGSCLVRYGETVVLVTATMSPLTRENINFFPLSVDFEERLYSVGRIPGSFTRREGKPSDQAIIAARQIDRALRPLFNQNIRNEIAISCLVLNNDEEHCPILAGMIGSSIALLISDIPFLTPIVTMNVGIINEKFIINPTNKEKQNSSLDLTISFTKNKIIMIELFSNEIDEEKILEAVLLSQKNSLDILNFMENIRLSVGKSKTNICLYEINKEIYTQVEEYYNNNIQNNNDFYKYIDIKKFFIDLKENFLYQIKDIEFKNKNILDINESFYLLQKNFFRKLLWDEKRSDNRDMNEIRPLHAEVGIVPRTHGSALFTRGDTQVMSFVTLGTASDKQEIDTIFSHDKKSYIHHYNFPSFSVGEAKRSRAPGRREIGHGILVEKTLSCVIPSEENFPYVIRVVSEILSSNGSTSQGSICASTLALMDAGVPLKSIIAGISCGLITKNNKFKTFIDIQGMEDFFGDMDFKVAGSVNGVNSIQLDIKIDGLSFEIIKEALNKCRKARIEIINNIILPTIPCPRKNVSIYAPKIINFKIDKLFIRDVIGKGGSIIQRIINETQTKIDINNDGIILISSDNINLNLRAKKIIENITVKPKLNQIYENARVVKITLFGAFVEFAYGKEGFLHISKISNKHVNSINDVLKLGDKINVKIIHIDDKNKINLSINHSSGE